MKTISWRPSERALEILEKVSDNMGYNRNQTINYIIENAGTSRIYLLEERAKHQRALDRINIALNVLRSDK